MNGVNKVIILGAVGDKPEIRFTAEGSAIANFSVATSEKFTKKDGASSEATEWHKLVAFGDTAKHIEKYVDKGSIVYVEGKLRTRKWQDKNGIARYTTEIIVNSITFLSKKDSVTNESSSKQHEVTNATQNVSNDKSPFDDFVDDIPF